MSSRSNQKTEDHQVQNVTLTPANVWVIVKFPWWTESWMMQARTAVNIDWRPTGRRTLTLTLKAGYVHFEDTNPRFIWARSATAGVVLELRVWGRR